MYKKFIIRLLTIVFGLYLIFIYIVFNHKMLYMNREYPMWLNIKNIMNTKSDQKYDLIMLGDSRAKAGFIPNNNSTIKSLNLAIGGGTPIEGFYILKTYLQNNPAPKKIIFSYAPSHLDGQDVYWERTVKYDFLNQKDYIEVEQNAIIINDTKTLGSGKSYTDYQVPIKYGNDFKNGIVQRRWSLNKIVYDDCTVSKGHYFFGRDKFSDGLNDESKKRLFIESALIKFYFLKLIKLAEKNHIKLYYYTMPFNESSYNQTPSLYKKGYEQFLHKIVEDNNIKQCNNLSLLSNDKFGDPSHLYNGANIATNEIFHCITTY